MTSFDSLTFWATTRAVDAGVFGDLLDGGFDGPADDVDADLLVVVGGFLADACRGPWRRADDGDAAAGEDAFFDGCAAGVQGVFDAGLLFLHRDFGGRADVDLGDAAGELGEALLELLAVVVAGGVVDLVLDLLDAALDGLLVAGAFDDRGVVLVDADLLGPAESELDVFELDAELFEDRRCRR